MRFTFWTALALISVTEARRSRTEDNDVLEDEPQGFDASSHPGRRERPSGFEATNDAADEDRQFNRWSAHYGKGYKTLDQYKEREENWRSVNTMIRKNNEKAELSGDADAAYMDHNDRSDMTSEEIQRQLGFMDGKNLTGDHAPLGGKDGRDLARKFKDELIDWPERVRGPVQNQGGCGSCWAFSAATPLEAAIVLEQDKIDQAADSDAPLNQWRALSKQHLVDCTYQPDRSDIASANNLKSWLLKNYGCDGGRQDWTWEFMRKHGAIWESDYGDYTSGRTRTEGNCTHSENPVAVKIRDYVQIQADPWAIRDKLRLQPLSIGIAVGNKLSWYSSGRVQGDDDSWCANRINHVVTLTGYNPGAADTKETETKVVPQCRRRWNKDKPECRNEGEYVWKRRYCCKDIERQVESSDAEWMIMNEWGTGWGEDGFLRAQVTEGDGFCGINLENYTIQPKMSTLTYTPQ